MDISWLGKYPSLFTSTSVNNRQITITCKNFISFNNLRANLKNKLFVVCNGHFAIHDSFFFFQVGNTTLKQAGCTNHARISNIENFPTQWLIYHNKTRETNSSALSTTTTLICFEYLEVEFWALSFCVPVLTQLARQSTPPVSQRSWTGILSKSEFFARKCDDHSCFYIFIRRSNMRSLIYHLQ